MQAKKVSSPIASDFKLSAKECPTTSEKKMEMQNVPYASTIGSLMYIAMLCTRPNIAYTVIKVSRFISKLGKQH